jgi:putative addiction module antidote
MLTQKLYRNGNSVAVTIPKEYLEELQLKEGSEVVVEKRAEEVVITSRKQILAQDVDGKFAKMVDDFISEHEDVLQELSQR